MKKVMKKVRVNLNLKLWFDTEKNVSSTKKRQTTFNVQKVRLLSFLNTNEAADVLAYLLPKIINLSVKLLVFPDECKIAKLKPLFMKGPKTGPNNYKSIWEEMLQLIITSLKQILARKIMF